MRPSDRPRPQPPRALFRPNRRRRRPAFDLLDERIVPSKIITVNNLTDAASLPAGQVSLRTAITQADADSGDTIVFKKGLSGTIALNSALPDVSANMTIVGPGAKKLSILGNGPSHAFSDLTVDSGVASTISGLTLTGGNVPDIGGFRNGYNPEFGGGVDNNGTLTLANVTLANNRALLGGGIYNGPTGVLTIANSIISGNEAHSGAGIANTRGRLTVLDSSITGNGGAGIYYLPKYSIGETYITGFGGGISSYYGALTIDGSVITGNVAAVGAGVDASYAASLSIDNTTISSNIAEFFGGGVEVDNPPASGSTISDSTISGNTAVSGGGIFLSGYYAGSLTLANCVVSDNAGSTSLEAELGARPDQYTSGGGIAIEDQPLTVIGGSIRGNSADYGAGVELDLGFYRPAALTIVAGTVSGNMASASGGGVDEGHGIRYSRGYTSATYAPSVQAEDCLITGNTAASSGGGFDNAGTLSLVASTVSGNTATFDGGGVANRSQLSVTDSAINDNTSAYGSGGGIETSGTLTLSGGSVSNNTAQYGGGGIDNEGGTATISGADVSKNAATAQQDSNGGGIENLDGATLTISDSTVKRNTSGYAGGGIDNDSSTLDVEDCDVDDNDADGYGGGIENRSGRLTVNDSDISGNDVTDIPSTNYFIPNYGGGIDNQGGTATISGSTITGDHAGDGGGVSNEYFYGEPRSSLTISDCDISGDDASDAVDPYSGDGGGLFNATDATVSNTTISGNSATQIGGGVVNLDFYGSLPGQMTISDCTISGNSASFGGGFLASGFYSGVSGVLTLDGCIVSGNTATTSGGGGRVSGGGSLVMDESTISGNSAPNGGGIWIKSTATGATIDDSTIASNTATASTGGGIDAYRDLTLTNSTVYGNTAVTGGGINVGGGTSTLTDATLADNRAISGDGSGGIASTGGTVILFNTLVAQDFSGATGSTPGDVSGPVDPSSSYNLIGDGTALIGIANGSHGNLIGTDASPINPVIAPLGDYGGLTETVALLPGSPAIGAGSSAYGPSTDQRGVARGASFDIGAFQDRGFTIQVVKGSTPQSAYVGSAFANPLALVVSSPFGDPVAGGVVTFTDKPVKGAGANLSAATATINSKGVASVAATADATPGSYTVTADASGVEGAGVKFLLTNVAQASIVGVSVGYGASGSAKLPTASDGLRLLAAGRNTDLPWLGIRTITLTLSRGVTLSAADVTVTGIAVANYGPVTITGSGTTYTITLAQPINQADRVTLNIGNAAIATYTRRIDVLPGDVNDDGVVNAQDTALERNVIIGMVPATPFTDVDGDGATTMTDYNKVRQLQGTKLPPLP